MATRDELNQLVSSLPEGALDQAKQVLKRLQIWPPRMLDLLVRGRERALAEMQGQMKERMQRMTARGGSVGGELGGFVGGVSERADGKQYGRASFGGEDEEGTAHWTTILQADQELRLWERLRLDEDAGTMTMKIVMLGPDQTTATFEHTFRLPQPEKA